MTAPRREWLRAFAQDHGTVSDVLAAARSCMSEACDESPEKCSHPRQRMTPLEFAQWLEEQLHRDASTPQRLDHRENREGGQHRRHGLELAVG